MVLKIANRGIEIDRGHDSAIVTVAAGEPWDEVVRTTVGENLAGIECLSGIPGTAGATPIQNVGAYGQEVGAGHRRAFGCSTVRRSKSAS